MQDYPILIRECDFRINFTDWCCRIIVEAHKQLNDHTVGIPINGRNEDCLHSSGFEKGTLSSPMDISSCSQKDADADDDDDSHQVHISMSESNFSGYRSTISFTSVDKFQKESMAKLWL
jgi:hypothetical protein